MTSLCLQAESYLKTTPGTTGTHLLSKGLRGKGSEVFFPFICQFYSQASFSESQGYLRLFTQSYFITELQGAHHQHDACPHQQICGGLCASHVKGIRNFRSISLYVKELESRELILQLRQGQKAASSLGAQPTPPPLSPSTPTPQMPERQGPFWSPCIPSAQPQRGKVSAEQAPVGLAQGSLWLTDLECFSEYL